MARKLRVEYRGAIYHVMSRGDHREAIFRDAEDRKRFLATLGEACRKTGWQVHALCLLSNHFHLVLETPRGNLAAGMKWFLGTYTARFNRRHKLFGHLFSGRYKALIVQVSVLTIDTSFARLVCRTALWQRSDTRGRGISAGITPRCGSLRPPYRGCRCILLNAPANRWQPAGLARNRA